MVLIIWTCETKTGVRVRCSQVYTVYCVCVCVRVCITHQQKKTTFFSSSIHVIDDGLFSINQPINQSINERTCVVCNSFYVAFTATTTTTTSTTTCRCGCRSTTTASTLDQTVIFKRSAQRHSHCHGGCVHGVCIGARCG